MNSHDENASFLDQLRTTFTTLPGALIGVGILVLIIWLSFNLFKPSQATEEAAVHVESSLYDETSPNESVETEAMAAPTEAPSVAAPTAAMDTETAVTADTVESAVAAPLDNLVQISSFLPIYQASPKVDAHTAAIAQPKGLVEIQTADGSWQTAGEGSTLKAGQHLRTGALSGAVLSFFDGSQAVISANSEISIDQLNAQRLEDGARTIVMTQWLGESEHHVATRDDEESLYEVKSPNGSGVARGTVFQVLVTTNLLTYYTVIEGHVDVTNVNITVVVLGGQITVINPNQPPSAPYFVVHGQGEVTAVGESWTIGGQTFATNEHTVIIGNPQIDDIAQVTGYMLPDGTLMATYIILLHHNPLNQFSLVGEVISIEPNVWVVAGQNISVTVDTAIDEAIVLGDTVRVQGLILEDGTFVADSIAGVDDEDPFEFVGIVTAIEADSWIIAGIDIAVNEETAVAEGIVVNSVVHVTGIILEDGTWLAHQIDLVEEEDDFEFTGVVNTIDPWVVAGIGFDVDEFTTIEEGIVVGSSVRVTGQILADGTWLATSVTLLDDTDEIVVTFMGTVESLDPWLVSGIILTTDDMTEIEAGIAVGDAVWVTAVILPDGTFLATQIVLVTVESFPVGCFTLATTILSVNGNIITVTGLPAITLSDDIIVEGTIAPNTVIVISYCAHEDGTITVINIIVIYTIIVTPPPPPPPPPSNGGNGGKVTICHKNRNTLSVSQSALGGHLGHGDTVGACH